MKYLLSIPQKINVEYLISLLDKIINKNISGFEHSSNVYNEMDKLINYCIKNNLYYRCHIPSLNNINDVYIYLDNVNNLANKYNINISITIHSLEDKDMNNQIKLTDEYLNSILNYIKINNYKIIISLENLNEINCIKRLNVEDLKVFLNKYDSLLFTYDVGHDLFDNKCLTKLTNIHINKLENIHIHNIKNNQDHHLIKYNCEYINELKEVINFLKVINYKNYIVLEIIMYFYEESNNLLEYIKSIDNIIDLLES